MFRHPKYYKELRKRNKSDQVISPRAATAGTGVHPGPGLKLPGPRPISNANKGLIHRRQAPSSKLQAPSSWSNKRQASSPKLQASSSKPQATSSLIREPRYIWKRLAALGPRAWTKINVLSGCLIWNAIWCGENLTFIPLVTFNSNVKKCLLLL